MKKVLLLVVILALFVLALFLAPQDEQHITVKPKITVSTFALYDIVTHLAGDRLNVEMVIPFGVDVHSFEPTPKSIIGIETSSLFLYSGAALEPWIKNLAQGDNRRDMSQYVSLLTLEDHHEEHHGHEGIDPHYWLDFNNMITLTQHIVKELERVDPKNRDWYQKSARDYIATLKTIDKAYTQGLAECKTARVVMHHNVLAYLARRYHFEVETITGLSPDALADAKRMSTLTKYINTHQIKTLFVESFVSDKVIKSLAAETGTKVDVILPLANITKQQAADKMSYKEGMLLNLKHLTRAMECQ